MGRGRSGRVASTAPKQPEVDHLGFRATDDADYHNLWAGRDYYNKQQLTDAQKEAMDFYAIPDKEPAWAAPSADGMHSPSQDLNWALANNIPMSAKQQDMYERIMSAMHNTGYNINLTRYDHAGFVNDILKTVGINSDATSMSIGDLKKALVGVKYGENRFVTGSNNDFANALGDGSKWNKKVFTQRFVKISMKVDANVQSAMTGDYSKKDPVSGLKNRLGEHIIAPSKAGNLNYEIVDVKYSGAKAHPKGSSIDSGLNLNQIELVVRVRKQ